MNEVVAIPVSMILARLLTPHEFGVAAAASFFVQVGSRMTNFGFNTALVQFKRLESRHVSTVFVVSVSVGAVVWLALTFGAPWLGAVFRSHEAAALLPVVALTFLISPVAAVPSALMARDLRFRESAMLDGLGYWVTGIVSVAAAALGYSYWSLAYAQILGIAVPTVFRVALSGWTPSLLFSREALRELLSFGLGLHAKRLLDSLAQNVDNLVVGRLLGVTALGFYDKAFTMMNRAVMLLSSAGPAVSLRVLVLIGDDDARFRAGYRKLIMASTFLAYPLLAGLVAVAPELFLIMFGPQWEPAVWPFRVLCVAGALKVLNGYASSATQSRGRVWGEVWRQTAYVTLIVGGAALGSHWGLGGAAVGVLAATATMTLAMHDLLRRASSVDWGDVLSAQVPAAVFAASLAASIEVLRLAARAAFTEEVPALLFLAAAGGVSAGVLLLLVRLRLFPELDELLREMAKDYAPWCFRLVFGREDTEATRSRV